MERTAPVTPPEAGEYRLLMPRASRPVLLSVERTQAGHALLRRGRRAVGLLSPSGYFEGHAWAREALAAIGAGQAEPIIRCADCRRELTDDDSKARGFGPDCWAARSSA